MQSNAHEVMMGILNSRSALVVHIPDIIRFEMLTTGQNLSVSECIIETVSGLVICSNCQGRNETISQSS